VDAATRPWLRSRVAELHPQHVVRLRCLPVT
jgi:hypothetical protein